MMSPQDVLQGQRQIAPRTSFSPKIEGGRSTRDDRRRATHNEGLLFDMWFLLLLTHLFFKKLHENWI